MILALQVIMGITFLVFNWPWLWVWSPFLLYFAINISVFTYFLITLLRYKD